MKRFLKRNSGETATEGVLLQEVDERHFIAEQVFSRREHKGWSQDQLAGQAGMTQAQVALIEAGQANPTLRSLVKLAQAFGCSLSELTAAPATAADDTILQPDAEAVTV